MNTKEYHCTALLFEALDTVALPVMKKAAQGALNKRLSAEDGYRYVVNIMQNYKDYKKTVIPADDPLARMDMTALWFFLYPFNKEESDDIAGAMEEYVAAYCGLSKNDVRKISLLRNLRNAVVHKNPELITNIRRDCGDDLGAIAFIEQALVPLDATVPQKIAPIRAAIREKLKSNAADGELTDEERIRQQQEERLREYRNMLNTLRKDYSYMKGWDFAKAPIGMPIIGPAPWAETEDDIEDIAEKLVDFCVEENARWKKRI